MLKNFFIAFFERSGSTMLVDLLNQHSQVQCRMEIFDTKDIQTGKRYQQIRQLNEAQVQEVLNFFKKKRLFSKTKTKGFKFKYPNQIDKYLDVYTYLIENQFKCIFLLRKNLLKAAVSHQYHKTIRKKTGFSNIRQKVDLEMQGLGTLKAIKYMELRDKQNKHFEQKLYTDFKQVKKIYYEDLLYNKQSTMEDIFQFLQVTPQQVHSSKFKKIVDDDLKNAIKNYDWVQKILRYTPYIGFFYKDEITSQDIVSTKRELIQFYDSLEIHIPRSPQKNTYHHQLQKPLSLTDKEVHIFRKLNQFYYNKLNKLDDDQNNDPHARYKKNMFKKIKQLEVKLFLGEEKYQLKWAFDKTYKTLRKPTVKQVNTQKKLNL